MAVSAEYQAYLAELFEPIPNVAFRRMFVGLGVFHDGLMFALVARERLYFKADDASEARFVAADCEPFTYTGKGKEIRLGYWSAPDAALDDPEMFEDWARLAIEAARRKAAAKPKRPRTRKQAGSRTK